MPGRGVMLVTAQPLHEGDPHSPREPQALPLHLAAPQSSASESPSGCCPCCPAPCTHTPEIQPLPAPWLEKTRRSTFQPPTQAQLLQEQSVAKLQPSLGLHFRGHRLEQERSLSGQNQHKQTHCPLCRGRGQLSMVKGEREEKPRAAAQCSPLICSCFNFHPGPLR